MLYFRQQIIYDQYRNVFVFHITGIVLHMRVLHALTICDSTIHLR